MAGSVIDGAMGFIPMYTPRESQVTYMVVVDTKTVYPGQVVDETAGGIQGHTPGAAERIPGICLDYVVGDGVLKAAVCTDPEMRYRVLGNDAYEAANVAMFAGLVATTGNAVNTSTNMSAAVLDTANLTDTEDNTTLFQVVHEYDVVTNSTNLWYVVKPAYQTFQEQAAEA